MKRFVWLLLVASCFGQGYNSYQQIIYTTVAASTRIYQANTIGFHQLSWTVSGTVSTCIVQIDSSPDAITWTPAGIMAGQTCTTNGSSAIVAGSAFYVRQNMVTFTGTGSVTVTYKGWTNNPAGGGGGGVSSINGNTGPFTFNGGAVSCSTTTCTFAGTNTVLYANSPAFNCVGDNTTINDACWAALQSAAAGGDFAIYFPKGTYKWAVSPSFSTPVTIVCEPGAIFNYTGTGNEITFADIGTAAGITFDFHPYRVLNCGHIGGATATWGVFAGFNHWKVEISENWWYNWGNTTNYAVYCHGNNECILHYNKYWQDTGAATNWVYAPDAGTAGWGAITIDHNDLNCVANVSGVGAPTQGACGIGMWVATTTGTQIVDNPFVSAFAVAIRLDPSQPAVSVMVARNYIEENTGGVGIQYGNPANGAQTVDSIMVQGNRFSAPGTAVVVAPANASTKLSNSSFANNLLRIGSNNVPLVSLNNVTGQLGNCATGNVNFSAARTPTADATEPWTDCNQNIGTNTSRVSNSTSGGSTSGFLAHTTTAGGAYAWQSDDGAVDQKTWDFIQATGSNNVCFRAVNDANTAATNVFCATRGTGDAVANITFSTAVVPPVNALASLPVCSTTTEGSHAVANNCNAAPSAGGTCTAGGTTHAELYCNGSAYVETGR